MFKLILIVISFYIFYKIKRYNKEKLIPRDLTPKICIFINNDEYHNILELLSFQNYPKSLFDVYLKNNDDLTYNFKTYKYNSRTLMTKDYDIICVINSSIDINYLNYTIKEYQKGYDVIISNSSKLDVLLVKRNINKFFNNSIFDCNFSFSFDLYKENIINLESPYLRNFLSHKTNLIVYSPNSETFEEHNFLTINTLDTGFIYFKLYYLISIFFVFLITNNLIQLIVFFYAITIIDNLLFLYRYKQVNFLSILLLPFSSIYYLLKLFIDNKRSNVNTV